MQSSRPAAQGPAATPGRKSAKTEDVASACERVSFGARNRQHRYLIVVTAYSVWGGEMKEVFLEVTFRQGRGRKAAPSEEGAATGAGTRWAGVYRYRLFTLPQSSGCVPTWSSMKAG